MALPNEDSFPPSPMFSSTSSSFPNRQTSAQIAKTYRQAAQLFLTRRLPEALSTIEPVIIPPQAELTTSEQDDGEVPPALAPIATASRGTRVKVWSFYLTFLNAVVELGPEEGKHAFGSAKWKALVAKCRDGSVWEDVVRVGYRGVEGDVDAEVVINLATLLLTHSPFQTLNQQRLETYLSASSNPTLDITSHLSSSLHLQRRSSVHGNGTNTPRDLNTRLKLLELYTLHVLPRNDEWDYAREFISMSEVLDDERKEAFLLALYSLKEEKEHAALREAELRKQQQEQLEQREAKQREAEAQAAAAKAEEERRAQQREDEARCALPVESSRSKTASRPNGAHATSTSARARGSKRSLSPPPGLYKRASSILGSINNVILNTAQSMTANPVAMIRTLIFVIAVILAFGRRDLRERLKRFLRNAWEKIKRTVGMGVKVSYI